jgi:hypothetical protein
LKFKLLSFVDHIFLPVQMEISWLQTDLKILLFVCAGTILALALLLLYFWSSRIQTEEKNVVVVQVEESTIVDLYNYQIPGKNMIATRPPKNPLRTEGSNCSLSNMDSISTIAETGQLTEFESGEIRQPKQSTSSSPALLFRL